MINEKVEEECVTRLNRVEGQVKGIEKMIKERRYCVDVVMQIAAAEAALHKVSEIILRNHLETCVTAAFRSSDEEERKRKVDELMEIYTKIRVK
ncbi:MAG: transcriptional regulator [bacterium (Candidatus Stahlbacteria) CG08_land_8_20_14_0_20_40_26]|nr:MAG: transcriptional regulator [bacterium (Candidatus Stahlbacteria) CG23_combo_of_CG06-09_8_20_14_all_40_9]PIS24520.1 MAG: transcriptional regulator [bacterium (Candidatus Stahlbacteria) CG08_land_8_20_14_0_20_40_26]